MTSAAAAASPPPTSADGLTPLSPPPEVDDRRLYWGRAAVETDYYEREHFAHVADKPYLGRVANGVWEIRSSLAKVALGHVLGTLVHSGHVVELADGGFVAANLYRRGVAFERKRAGGPKDALPDVELELSEYEIQRRERMARNEAMLKSLGF